MKVRSGLFPLLLAVLPGVVPLACTQVQQQTAGTPPRARTIPAAKAAAPFAIDSSAKASRSAVEFRSSEQMNQPDRLLAANYESSIAEAAARQGFDLNTGRWSYEQIVCPALPSHLFLRYTRNAGMGDVTVFSASVPRGSEGRVRIVPILKRSYSLFSPAPINALTISAFNHIRAEEPAPQRAQGWLGNGLCYAALAGGNPQAPAASGILTVTHSDGQVIRFTDAAASGKPKLWSMTFAPSGKLVKAALDPASENAAKPISAEGSMKTHPVPQSEPSASRPVPAGEPVKSRPIPQGDPALKTWPVPKS
jgi:hypothetical protein